MGKCLLTDTHCVTIMKMSSSTQCVSKEVPYGKDITETID